MSCADLEQVKEVRSTVLHFLQAGGRFLLMMPLRERILEEVVAVQSAFSQAPFSITLQQDTTVYNPKSLQDESFRYFEIQRQ